MNSKVKSALVRLKKAFPDGQISLASEFDNSQGTWTGVLSIDYLLLGARIPYGGVVTLWGHNGTGKTTLASLIATAKLVEEPDSLAVYCDMENAIDLQWLRDNGLDKEDQLILFRGLQNMQAYFDSIIELTELSKEDARIHTIILDSLNASIPIELQDEPLSKGDPRIASRARALNNFVARFSTQISKQDFILVAIAQHRDNISAYGGGLGNESIGNAFKHMRVLALTMRQPTSQDWFPYGVKRNDSARLGVFIPVQLDKWKHAPLGYSYSGRVCHFPILSPVIPTDDPRLRGYNKELDTLQLAIDIGLIHPSTKRGQWEYNGDSVVASHTNLLYRAREKGWLIEIYDSIAKQLYGEDSPLVEWRRNDLTDPVDFQGVTSSGDS